MMLNLGFSSGFADWARRHKSGSGRHLLNNILITVNIGAPGQGSPNFPVAVIMIFVIVVLL